jgi:DNA polymerase-1
MAKKDPRQKSFAEFDDSPPQADGAETSPPVQQSPATTYSGDGSVYVIDAHSLIYQVFFAVGNMTSPAGQPVNAVFGFLRDILDIIEKRKPTWLICTFDRSEVTFRNELFEGYKAHRDPMPDDLRCQIPVIQELLHALHIPVMDIANYEADDIMATIAREVDERGDKCFLVTSDKDCRQLITGNVKLYNIRKNEVYDESALLKDWGIRPEQVVDFQAMVGDSVDNVPGIPSIGPKTAQKLLHEFHSLDGLLKNLDKLKSGKQRETIAKNTEIAQLSRNLVRLDDHVPIKTDWEKARIGNIDVKGALELCNQLGFRSLAERIGGLTVVGGPESWVTRYFTVSEPEELRKLVKKLLLLPRVAIDTETTDTNPRAAQLVGFSLSWETGTACYVPVASPEGQPRIDAATATEIIRPLLESSTIEKIGQNLKYDISVLRKAGIDLAQPLFDTMVADYLLDSGQRNHGIDDLARRYFNHQTTRIGELIGTGKNQRLMSEVDVDRVTHYAAEDADIPFRLYPLLAKRLGEAGLERLFYDLEMPLVQVLADMEYTGIRVDTGVLQRLSHLFSGRIEALQKQIYELAGEPFNIDSPQQLATILFDRLQLPVVKKTATGRSTAVDVLETLAERHELPRRIIEYRQFAKLKSTYTDALVRLVNPETGRVHTSFMQDVAATGRLSSKDPNLQNIPIRTATGREIREAFVPDPSDWQLMSCDYSQIELRMLAHFTGDEALMNAFRTGQDIHAAVAAEINGVAIDEVTSSMRRAAKSVNFGIIYGQTPFGLARAIGISKEEASAFIDAYFARYPSVEEFTRKTLSTAFREGSVSTILGRQRRIEGVRDPEQLSSLRFLNFAERTAVNTVIQGSAADLIKLAMIHVHRRLRQEALAARLLLQIHDELVLEFLPAQVAAVARAVGDEMTHAVELRVPVQVDIETGPNWSATRPIDFRPVGD